MKSSMGKDIKDVLEKIEEREGEVSTLEAKIERLTELVERQKKVITEQEHIIEEQKKTQTEALEVPEDIRDLKEIIGMQRALLNEKDMELEHAKGAASQAQKEAELYKGQTNSFDQKYTDALEQVGELKAKLAEKEGQLKAKLAEKESELLVKEERVQLLENRVKESRAFDDKYKEEYTKEIDTIRTEYRNELENLTKKHAEEKQELQTKLTKLETLLLESEFMSGEKGIEEVNFEDKFNEIYTKQKDLISKIEQVQKEKSEALNQVKSLEEKLKEYQEHISSIQEYEKLKPLMEQEGIFKAYFIIKDVGHISLDDLRNAVGSPIVLVRKMVDQLTKLGLIEEEEGKISPLLL